MNKTDFLTLVKEPKQMTDQENGALSDILSSFPYFHAAHLLLLYGLKKTASGKYDQQLRESAIQVPDRHILFNLVYNLNVQAASALQEKEQVRESPVAKPKEVKAENQVELLEIDETNQASSVVEKSETVELPNSSNQNYNTTQTFELEYDTIPKEPETDQHAQPSPFDLIEKFIEENPAFVPNRLDMSENREDISISSIQEDEEVATETLASVYVSQKLYQKAISVYEKLILKFPEKSAYFASRIEELRNNVK